jgi:hypothetical protein
MPLIHGASVALGHLWTRARKTRRPRAARGSVQQQQRGPWRRHAARLGESTATCACKPPRIGLPASTSTTLATAASQGGRCGRHGATQSTIRRCAPLARSGAAAFSTVPAPLPLQHAYPQRVRIVAFDRGLVVTAREQQSGGGGGHDAPRPRRACPAAERGPRPAARVGSSSCGARCAARSLWVGSAELAARHG